MLALIFAYTELCWKHKWSASNNHVQRNCFLYSQSVANSKSIPTFSLPAVFSRAFERLHVLPRFWLVTCFPALSTAYVWHPLSTGYMFSRAFHRLRYFPRFSRLTCVTSLSTGYMFSDLYLQNCIFYPQVFSSTEFRLSAVPVPYTVQKQVRDCTVVHLKLWLCF